MANNINKFIDKAGLTRLISWIKSALNSKQDTISDLADIRNGAKAGVVAVPKKSTTSFYPFIGSNSGQKQWYKVTFPWSGYTSSDNAWMMTSMELVFGSGHTNSNIGRIYLQYYIKKTTSNTYENIYVKGLVVGTRFKENSVFIKYELNNPGILYIRANVSIFNTFAIENLSANDSARRFDFRQTIIESIEESQDMPSDLKEVPLTYTLMATGTSSQFVKGDGSLEQYFGIYGDSKHVYNVCNISYKGFAKHFAIYTTLPYISGSGAVMPVVTIKGFKYPEYDVESKISFYIFNNEFYQPHIQNLGAFALTAYLFSYDDNGTERVGIGLEASEFYLFGAQIDVHFPVMGESHKPTRQWTYTYDNVTYTTETANEDRIIPPIGTNHCVKITENTLATTTKGNVKKTGDTMTGALGVPTASTANDVTKGINFKNGSTNVAHIGGSTLLGLYSAGPIYLGPNNATSAASSNGSIEIANDGIRMHEVITAEGFKKTDGTSSQFLKADGSVDSNTYLTSYTETDPTVPAWAKASTKPSYNGSEVTTAIDDPRGNFSSGDSIDEALSGISNDLTTVENAKQDTLTFDTTPTANSNNPVTSGGVKAAIDALGTPNEIASITTQESSASGGNNVVTITDTDGTVTSFNVKNGKDGKDGADGADGVSLGEIALVQTTGDSEESVMSQAAVTRELQIAPYIYRTPTYLQGRLCYYKLTDYPQLDPRTADGISIAFNINGIKNERCMMFAILNPNASVNQGFATRYFGLTSWDGYFKFGFFSSYGSTTTGGYSFERIKGHYVITYNFKTGVCKCYRNGVLSYTQTPSNWDEQSIVRDYFSNCTHITLNALPHSGGDKQSGIALFGRELTEQAVKDLYGNGTDTIKTVLISNNLKAYNLSPIYPSWQIQVFSNYATTSTATDGGINIAQKGSAENNWQQFGFKGLSGFINNATLEFDFELISGSIKYIGRNYDRTWHGNSTSNNYANNVYTITDENENDVTYSDLEMGHVYHVVANPDFIASGTINSNGNLNHFIFSGCSADCIIHIKPVLKVTEHGAALECSISTYAGTYWELANGIKLPLNTTTAIYGTEPLYIGTDTYISNVVKYSSSVAPQFNGQIAVDTVNGKVYIGYLTGTGGTWKQVSN